MENGKTFWDFASQFGRLITSLFLGACVFVLIALSIMVHRFAEPGTNVTLLFGAISYTKPLTMEAELENLHEHLFLVSAQSGFSVRVIEACEDYGFQIFDRYPQNKFLRECVWSVEQGQKQIFSEAAVPIERNESNVRLESGGEGEEQTDEGFSDLSSFVVVVPELEPVDSDDISYAMDRIRYLCGKQQR